MKHKQVRWIIYFPLENKIYLCNCKIQPHNRLHITFHFLKNTLYCITHMYLRLNKFCIQCFANIICTQADLILLLLCILLFRKNFTYLFFRDIHKIFLTFLAFFPILTKLTWVIWRTFYALNFCILIYVREISLLTRFVTQFICRSDKTILAWSAFWWVFTYFTIFRTLRAFL